MKFNYFLIDNILFLKIQGNLLGYSDEKKIVNIVEYYIKIKVKKCVIDLSEINHMNSKGLSLIIKILNKLDDAYGSLVVSNPTEQVKRILSITKLDLIFRVVQDRTEAIHLIHNESL